MIAILDPVSGTSHVNAQVWLDGTLCGALDAAARDARTSRADYLRRLILESVRLTGHLAPLPTPNRYRGPRRLETTQ